MRHCCWATTTGPSSEVSLDGQNSADLDSDGLLDGVELWINLIDGIQVGFASDIPWLSEDPVEGVIAPDSDLADRFDIRHHRS
jgi:hypothetical protein